MTAGVDAAVRLRLPDGSTLDLARTRVMAIVNLTPDSFWAGSRTAGVDDALRRADRAVEAGADLLDIGGESSRPGADPVDSEEETARVVPAIEAICRRFDVRVSIDTVKADVAERALDAGAAIVNDISALGDPRMAPLLARRGAAVVLMHMRGEPRTMQRDTTYDDVVVAVRDHLSLARRKATEAGVDDDKILLDPGIGFGKDEAGNLELLRRLPELGRLGRPILVGASRKAFIGRVLDLPVEGRLEGSMAVAAIAAWQGARVIRAHDVRETVRIVRMVDAIRER